MYLVNGVPLENDELGWQFLPGTKPFGGISISLASITVPGRPGNVNVPGTRAAPRLTFVMRVAELGIEPLLILLRSAPSVISYGDRSAVFTLLAISDPELIPDDDGFYKVAVIIEIPGAAWRDEVQVFGPTVIANPVQEITLLDGISAEVFDADVFVSGLFGQFEIVDPASGTWVRTVKPWAGSADTGLLFVGSTGQAFAANAASPWVPTSDAGDFVDQSGGGGFRITPELPTSDPTVRRGRLRLTTLEQTSVTIRVRAAGAYLIRAGAL